MIPKDFIQNLVDQANIIDVIGDYVQLKKKGVNFVGLCPFHSEKTPSFSVNREKNFYHCFGCGAHGNVISFLMEQQNINFVDAVYLLAKKAGIDVPNDRSDTNNEVLRKKNYVSTLSKVIDSFKKNLKNSDKAISFLKKRGLIGKTAALFHLGFSTDNWQGLSKIFEDYSKNTTLRELGIVINSDSGKLYDRFRNRIMFPIYNAYNEPIGFGARVITDEKQPKYLNSPESYLFKKSQELYGFPQARKSIYSMNEVLIVEGYMDVLILNQFNVKNIVATLGTAVSSHQIQKLIRIADNLIFAYDGDLAGKKASWKALEICLPLLIDGKKISFLFFPEGEDPDSFVRNHGKENFIDKKNSAIPLSEFIINHLKELYTFDNVENKIKIFREFENLLSKVKAPLFKKMMAQKISDSLNIPLNLFNNNSKHKVQGEIIEKKKIPRLVRNIIGIVAYEPILIKNLPSLKFEYFKEIPEKIITQLEFSFLNELKKIDKKAHNLIEFFRDTEYEDLIKKSITNQENWSFLDKKSLKIELSDCFEKLNKQIFKVEMNVLLKNKNPDNLDKKKILELQKKYSI